MKFTRSLSVWIFLVVSLSSSAQDVQLSQFHVADLLINPALAGGKHRNRFMFHQRWQWPSLQGQYNTSFFSFDKYLHKARTGIGSYLAYDNQGEGIMNSLVWNIQACYEVDLSKKWSARFGLQGGLFNKRLKDNNLVYPNQVTSTGIDYSSNGEFLGSVSYTSPDFGAGLVLYTDKFWFSASSSHFNRPFQDFIIGNERLPMKHLYAIGYKVHLGSISPTMFTGHRKEFYLFPTIHYKFQGKSDQIEVGADMIDDQLRIGFWYRGIPFKKYNEDLQNNESFIFLAGWRYKNLEFVYSYDAVISRLQRARTGGAHELHISFIWPLAIIKKNYKKLPCPDFQKSIHFDPVGRYQGYD